MRHAAPAFLLLALSVLAAGVSVRPEAVAAPDAASQPVRDTPARRGGTAVIRGVVVDGMTGASIRRAAVSLVIEEPDRDRGQHAVGVHAPAAPEQHRLS